MIGKVFEIIKKHNKAITREQLESELTEEEKTQLQEALDVLEDDFKIRVTNKGKYEVQNDPRQRLGVLDVNPKGYGFVSVEGEEEDYHIAKENLNNAIDGDTVIITIINEKRHEAAIKRIKQRNIKDQLVGEFYIKDGKNFVALDDDKLKIIVEIPKEKSKKAIDGHKVIIKLTEHKEGTNYYQGEVLQIIGHKNDPGVDILSIAARHDIFPEVPIEVEEQLKTMPEEVIEAELHGRVDLTNEMIFTIDGADTKDIDDAISCEILPNGNYKLGVHIADVSHYVKENTPLYEDAFKRGTSSYLADTVIPMLPHQLSNGICSLNPDVIRLTISCVMEIDENGNVVDSDIFQSYIKSNKKMTYDNVNEIIEKNNIPEGYEKFADKLKQMHELAKILRKAKVKKGYLDFNIDEPKIIIDENKKAIDVQKRIRGEGEKLIEDFMIVANETVATTIHNMSLPFIYRIHGNPIQEKIQNFLGFLNILGYKVNCNLNKITPLTIQSILDQIKDKPEAPILSSILLRSMQKAVYDTNNIGHFGLGSRCYTHFTSPIRRFPDLNVHRLLRVYLFEKQINNSTIDYYNRNLPLITKQSSERERIADDCEREVTDMKMAEYMESNIGKSYEGTISSVTNHGIYVELPNLVEGLVSVEDLPNDYYIYQENAYCLIGKRSKRRFMLGDKVKIKVDSVIKEKGQINFLLDEEKNGNKKSKSKI